MFRFIHAADIHLDSPLRGLDQDETAPKERIRNATRVALKNLVDFALEEKVDFLLIAGDLYDGDWSDYATGHILLGQLRRMAPTPVYMIHGNHDALSKTTRSLPMPAHVHVFGAKQAEPEKLDEIRVALYGRSFGSTPAQIMVNRTHHWPAVETRANKAARICSGNAGHASRTRDNSGSTGRSGVRSSTLGSEPAGANRRAN